MDNRIKLYLKSKNKMYRSKSEWKYKWIIDGIIMGFAIAGALVILANYF